MEVFLGLLGIGALVLCLAAFFALTMYGWPRFFTINIHKHYHKKEK